MTRDDTVLPEPRGEGLDELWTRWRRDGDVDALDELLRRETAALASRLRARAGPAFSAATSASDLAQEAVLRWLRLETPPDLDDPGALRGYLWTAAWRLFLNRAQRPQRDLVRLGDDESRLLSGAFAASGDLGRLAADEQRTALEVVVNLLPAHDRECLALVYFEGLSIEEAAGRAGVARATFDMRLLRARRRLAERLVDWADVVG